MTCTLPYILFVCFKTQVKHCVRKSWDYDDETADGNRTNWKTFNSSHTYQGTKEWTKEPNNICVRVCVERKCLLISWMLLSSFIEVCFMRSSKIVLSTSIIGSDKCVGASKTICFIEPPMHYADNWSSLPYNIYKDLPHHQDQITNQ